MTLELEGASASDKGVAVLIVGGGVYAYPGGAPAVAREKNSSHA